MHEEGFKSALTAQMNRYAKEKNLIKEKEGPLQGDGTRALERQEISPGAVRALRSSTAPPGRWC